MRSITKRELRRTHIEQMVMAAFGSQVKIQTVYELTDGYFNNSYRIKLTNNEKVVLKVAPRPKVKVLTYEKELMKTEVAVLKLMFSLGIPVPNVLFYDDTLFVIDSEYFFMTFLEGVPLNKVKESIKETQYQELCSKVGSYLGLSKQISNGSFGEVSNEKKKYNDWYSCFCMMISDLMDDAHRIKMELPLSKEEAMKLVEINKSALSAISVPSLVHKDLWEGNIFVDRNNFELVGIIDCERAINADPLMEVVCGFFESNKAFINSYYGTDRFNAEEEIRIKLYRFYLFLLMVVECPYREYEDQNQIEWANEMLNSSVKDLMDG